jgi:hypothetical protein
LVFPPEEVAVSNFRFRLVLAILFCGTATASVWNLHRLSAQDEVTAATKEGTVVDVRDVVVPEDNKPFTVEKNEIVRLTAHGIAGSTITPDVKGPAKVIRASYIRTVTGGETPIGGMVREFEILPTGKGQVNVTLTVEYPTGGDPKVEKYRFTVK